MDSKGRNHVGNAAEPLLFSVSLLSDLGAMRKAFEAIYSVERKVAAAQDFP